MKPGDTPLCRLGLELKDNEESRWDTHFQGAEEKALSVQALPVVASSCARKAGAVNVISMLL